MYLNNHYVYDNNPYGQTTYFHSTPFTNDPFYHEAFDVRQFGPGSPSQGGPMGPPPGQGSTSWSANRTTAFFRSRSNTASRHICS